MMSAPNCTRTLSETECTRSLIHSPANSPCNNPCTLILFFLCVQSVSIHGLMSRSLLGPKTPDYTCIPTPCMSMYKYMLKLVLSTV